jgi:hypothetical protein
MERGGGVHRVRRHRISLRLNAVSVVGAVVGRGGNGAQMFRVERKVPSDGVRQFLEKNEC